MAKAILRPSPRLRMIKRALEASVPFAWVAADRVYGVGDIEMVPRRAGKGYMLRLSNHRFGSKKRGRARSHRDPAPSIAGAAMLRS